MESRKRIIISIIVISLISLYGLTYFGFGVRGVLPKGYKIFFPLTYSFLFLIFVRSVLKYFQLSKAPRLAKALFVILFLLINTTGLFKLSSFHRKIEIKNYVEQNENRLKSIIDIYNKNPESVSVGASTKNMNIVNFFERDSLYYFQLYVFIGYGYGILKAVKSNFEKPLKIGGSPIVNWFNIKDGWYYYSYYD